MTDKEKDILLDYAMDVYFDTDLVFRAEQYLLLMSIKFQEDWFQYGLKSNNSLYNLMHDDATAKKLLINNELGVFGSIFYKYKDSFDEELIKKFIIRDLDLIQQLNFIDIDELILPDYVLNKDFIGNDKDFILDLIKTYRWPLKSIPLKLRNDKDIVTIAVKRDPKSFKYASDELRCDKEFIDELSKLVGVDIN